MVIRYSKDGYPYEEPPYNDEDVEEMEKWVNLPPIAVFRGRPDRKASPAPQEPEVE